jgi:hypothetical protein
MWNGRVPPFPALPDEEQTKLTFFKRGFCIASSVLPLSFICASACLFRAVLPKGKHLGLKRCPSSKSLPN